MIDELWGAATGGRHALDEDAVQTPIFHALKRGGGRRRQDQAEESLEEFRRDPLTAPIPVQLVASTREVPTHEVLGRPSREVARAARAPRETRSPREAGRAVARAAHEASARSAARSGSRSGAGREWADTAREWSREWSAALAGRGRHHREPVPAHW